MAIAKLFVSRKRKKEYYKTLQEFIIDYHFTRFLTVQSTKLRSALTQTH